MIWPKVKEDLAAFNVREVKRTAAEDKESKEYILPSTMAISVKAGDHLNRSSNWMHKDGGILLCPEPEKRNLLFFLHAISSVLSDKQGSCEYRF